MKLLHQPLIQFLFLGAVIFVIDRGVIGSEDDPRRIVIDDAKYAEIAGIYQDNQGRAPSEQEMVALTIQWAQNELLYREARLMGLDKGDEMIRQRLILKLRNVLFNRVVTEPPTEETLRAWFEAHRDKYDKPATFDFEQFRVSGPEGKEDAFTLATELGTAEPAAKWHSKRRHYSQRPLSNLVAVFGPEDAERLIEAKPNQWVSVSSRAGWHLSRITARFSGERVEFSQVRTRVGEDWKTQANQAELRTALQAMAARYDIRVELTAPPEEWDAQRIQEARLAMGVSE